MQEHTDVRTVSWMERWAIAGLLAVWVWSLGAPPLVQAASGDLDPTFGSGGVVTTSIGSLAYANALAMQADGKLVAAGRAFVNGVYSTALARYNVDGSLDGTFGSGGIVTTPIGGSNGAHALVIQADSKLVVAGTVNGTFALVRYNVDGSLDGTFGSGGVGAAPFEINSLADALAMQADGKLVAAGLVPLNGVYNIALARYNTDGSLDGTFGSGGMVTTPYGTGIAAYALAIQVDGKLVAAGLTPLFQRASMALVRYNTDGSLDGTFGSGGIVTTPIGSFADAWALAIQADGKLVATGRAEIGGPTSMALVRYNTDGSLDATFGSGGIVTTLHGWPHALVIQADGKLVTAGLGSDVFGFTLARYNADGSLDPTFGSGGVVTTPFEDGYGALALAIQANGKLVAAGSAAVSGVMRFALARYIEQTTVTFSAFTVHLELRVGSSVRQDRFELNGAFTLGAGSNGLAPLTEPVTLRLAGGAGAVSTTIPAGSFTRTGQGGFDFAGTVDGVALEAHIRPSGGQQFTFTADGTGADLTGFANPVTVTLTIGDDSGTTTVTAENR